MHLSTLLEGLSPHSIEMDYDIHGLSLDSRQIKPQDLFIAIKGTHLNGQKYISDAISRGAKAILIDSDSSADLCPQYEQALLIPIPQLKNKIGLIAARFYHHPAKQLRMIGITGTNGKTSCTHFIAQVLQALQIRCGMIGTLGSGFYGELTELGLTTPDAITLQKILHEFLMQNAQAVAMEVSSHSIDQGRIYGIEFETAIFTNLTQDHLDYHKDMQTYATVKRKFLAEIPNKHLIINADDDYGRKWINELAAYKSVFAYSTQGPFSNNCKIQSIYAHEIELSLQGINAYIYSPWGEGNLFLPLIGQFNLSNALAVLAALCLYGIPFQKILNEFLHLRSVPGRMQLFSELGKPLVVVDYSHTPDSLEKALESLRKHTEGKLMCVFGCGGERDQGKRPLMGKIAERFADVVIVTNDNPRHENPKIIADEILQGFSHPERVLVELDRSQAIRNSIQCASSKDCILIAGKGAERYQQIGDDKLPFDDAEKVSSYLNNR